MPSTMALNERGFFILVFKLLLRHPLKTHFIAVNRCETSAVLGFGETH